MRVLAANADARGQLEIALLLPLLDSQSGDNANARKQALARARDLSGQEALVAWLEARDCGNTPACDARAAFQRLQDIEPDNAAAWLLELEHLLQPVPASDAITDAQRLDLLRKAAQADRYDDHLTDTSRETLLALASVALPPLDPQTEAGLRKLQHFGADASRDELRSAFVASMATAMDIPSYASISGLCSVDRALAAQSPWLAPCRAVYGRMADGDSLIAQLQGRTRMVLLHPTGADAAHWREQLRQSHWLMASFSRAMSPAAIVAIREIGEVPALRAELARRGESEPPPDWLPQSPRALALITTGQLPAKP